MDEPDARRMTLAEFLAWTPPDGRRYELFEGKPEAMPTPGPAQRTIQSNLAVLVQTALASRPPCTARFGDGVHPTDPTTGWYYRPALAVTCQPRIAGQTVVPEPILIVEMIAAETGQRVWNTKLPDYRALPSVQEIMALDPECIHCELYRRIDATSTRWLSEIWQQADQVLELHSIGLVTSLAAIYEPIAVKPLSSRCLANAPARVTKGEP